MSNPPQLPADKPKIKRVRAIDPVTGLNARQEAFAQAVASGMTQSDAYRTAYNPHAKNSNLHPYACRIMAIPQVEARVAALRKELNKKQLWKREASVQVLASIAIDKTAKKCDRIRAVAELNKMHGWHEAQQIDLTSSDGSMTPRFLEVRFVNN